MTRSTSYGSFTCISGPLLFTWIYLRGKCAIIQYRFGLKTNAIAAGKAYGAPRGAKVVKTINWDLMSRHLFAFRNNCHCSLQTLT